MKHTQPLNDSWLFWNAERIEEFPHVSEDDDAKGFAERDAGSGEKKPTVVDMLEDLLLYLAGISAAVVGLGLAILFGSFISAYSALNNTAPTDRAAAVAAPSLSLQQSSPHLSAAPSRAGLTEPTESGEVSSRQMDFADDPRRTRSVGSKFVGRIYTVVPRRRTPAR